MKIVRFEMLAERLRLDEQLTETLERLALFRRFGGEWFEENGTPVTDEQNIRNFEWTLNRTDVWRERNSRETYFPVQELEGVMLGIYPSPPRKGTRDRTFIQIERCLAEARNAFDASHDPLTGLLNKIALRQFISDEIEAIRSHQSDGETSVESEVPHSTLSVISCDIDYFKQVNDSYSHQYGDQVLRSLARRLESKSNEIAAEYERRARITCARPSGEEFNIVISGAVTEDESVSISEHFRSSISATPLPSEFEWGSLENDGLVSNESMPPASERNLTISLGIASLATDEASDDAGALADKILKDSDIALYRAKTSGRNRSIHFSSILTSHGRVLEHHQATNTVAIDIGALVNVREGQEFFCVPSRLRWRDSLYFPRW